MTFMVLAHDATDPEALARRLRTRQQHLDGIRPHVESGVLKLGAAVLDDEGVMRGSVMILNLPDRAAVDAYLQADIYTREGVWSTFQVQEIRIATGN